MGSLLRLGGLALLGLGVACGIYGGCNAAKISSDRFNNVNDALQRASPQQDNFVPNE